jgi:hypothetical protein
MVILPLPGSCDAPHEWDPMSLEVEAGWLKAEARPTVLSISGLAQPILEAVTYEEENVPPSLSLCLVPPCQSTAGEISRCDVPEPKSALNNAGHCSRNHNPDVDPSTSGMFVMMSRGEPQSSTLPDAMDPTAFAQLVAMSLGKAELASTPRRRRTKPPSSSAPWRNVRLAKKACNRTPAIVAAQNMLIHKLGLASGLQMDTTNFEKYIALFQGGLSEKRAKMVAELIASRLPEPEVHVLEETEM